MISGETVTVTRPVSTGSTDGFGAAVTSAELEVVEDVVVAPGPTSDLDAARPEGVTVAFTLHFPKTFAGNLRGATVTVRGRDYPVVGDPQAYTGVNTPGKWNLPVEVEATRG